MNLRGTQSGRVQRVKKKDGTARQMLILLKPCRDLLIGFTMAGVVTACAAPSGGWQQPVKNEKLTQADYAACRQRAEESTLELNRSRRPGFGVLDTSSAGTFNPRGDNTMAIAERSDASTLFDALVANCMTQKGYRRATN
jgi:hypothetical protein